MQNSARSRGRSPSSGLEAPKSPSPQRSQEKPAKEIAGRRFLRFEKAWKYVGAPARRIAEKQEKKLATQRYLHTWIKHLYM